MWRPTGGAVALAIMGLTLFVLSGLAPPLPPGGLLAAVRPATRCNGERPGFILQPPISPAALPGARPPAWPSCGLRCAADTALVRRRNGAMLLQVVHKPIPGLTPEMLTWWFNGNVDGFMTHPVDGRNYSRYLVWHPRDHLEQTTLMPGPVPGNATAATWNIVEFFASADPRGFTRDDPVCRWANQLYTNTVLKVQRIDAAGLTLAFEVLPGLKALQLTHKWRASPAGLQLVSTMHVGFTHQTALAALANRVVKRAFGGHDPERMGRIWHEHCLEEMSNLQYFLPQLYAQHNPPAARAAAPRGVALPSAPPVAVY